MERDYIGVDLHKASFQACALSATGELRWEGRFERTPAGLAAFAARGIVGARVAVEALGPTWRFVDALQTVPVEVCVVDRRKTKLKAGYAAKTDKLDARRLADALRRESVVSTTSHRPRFASSASGVAAATTWSVSGRSSVRRFARCCFARMRASRRGRGSTARRRSAGCSGARLAGPLARGCRG